MNIGERILELLPATSAQLLALLGVGKATLHKWITRLRGQGAIHIGRRARTLGDQAAVWVAGPGKDAPRLKRRTRAQVQAKYRQSLKDAGLWEDALADQRRRNARSRPPRANYNSDQLLAALFKIPPHSKRPDV